MQIVKTLLAMSVILLASRALSCQERPPAALGVGDPADGKAFRILDRICKDVDDAVAFRGTIIRTAGVNRSESGGYSVCVNCAGGKAAPTSTPPSEPAKKEAAPEPPPGPLGDLLVCDLSQLYDMRFSGGALLYWNEEGYDADDSEYEVYPVAGPTTATYLVGRLLLVANQRPDRKNPAAAASEGFQLAMRRSGATFLAPLDGSGPAPKKVRDTESVTKLERDLARSHQSKQIDWGERYPTTFLYRDGTSKNILMESVCLLATFPDEFLLAIDLRKLESKQASYFWAPFRPLPSVHLDQYSLAVEGADEADENRYEPATYLEYPYLIVIGQYARLRVAPRSGGPESRLVIGFCDECP